MANTYTQIYIHVVFAVQERACSIKPEWKEELFKYIAGILKNQGIKLIAIGGVEDHIHILIGLSPKIALSDLVRDIKANSSKFINEKGFVRGNSIGKRVSVRFHIPVRKSIRSQNMF